ncbi:MAG TPA: hemerythrin domain-containing protein [Ilumatobacter sp.]|nr:hemerythrin domain-containing protein [Ilumatobacter sp.]
MHASVIDPLPLASDDAARSTREPADVTTYLAIHQAMRTANQQLVAGLVHALHYDPRRVAALRRWFAGYAAELRTHHRVEDTIIFPALAARSDEYATLDDSLGADHHRLDDLIDALLDILTRWAGCHDMRSTGSYREDAIFYAVELRDLLAEHLDVEDTRVIPLIQEHFTADEYGEFDKQAAKAISLKHALWTVPWIVATFDMATLEKVWGDAPAMLKLVHCLGRRSYARLAEAAFAGSAGAHTEIGTDVRGGGR